jgi:proliferating cell nuclear antigen
MRLLINDKGKQEVFVAIFQLLKNWSSYINIHFEKDGLYFQSMDKSHICLADIQIKDKWFSEYEAGLNNKISIDSTHFAVLMNFALKNDTIEMKFEDESNPDKLFVNFLNNKEKKGSFDHFFEINLIDVDEDNLGIPEVDYDVEFSIDSKKLIEVLSELNTFGSDLNIVCSEEIVELNSKGDSTKLKVDIPIDDLNEYAISEGEKINISFSLTHICKMCSSTKISPNINVCISAEYPMVFKYDLGEESRVSFFVAPKVVDN